MTAMTTPFPLPERLSPTLQQVFSYWDGLKRGGNDVPFWDDVALSALPDLGDRLMLIDVFANPERFRFSAVGRTIAPQEGLGGKFTDEVEMQGPLRFLRAQCSAAAEARKPTFYRQEAGGLQEAFARLILPLWGDGRVSMLLGAVE